MNVNYITKEGYDNLIKEVEYLESKERPLVVKQISEAREKGDLSENAEYDAAREAQNMLESKIVQLRFLIANSRLIDRDNVQTDSVQILNKVTLRNIKDNQIVIYTLVSDAEINLKIGKISVNTPIGRGLIGKKVGEIAEIKVPSGIVLFEIVNISV
ncbi:MAG: transcription elongation factor GreA [Bacteroidales bacterium OttesenSCG-928-I14]|jgi:transcription elongation factor GreA|nr:transcription elongation factor GreA [Bacteroidales bacterium OttesenSCG-928-I14]